MTEDAFVTLTAGQSSLTLKPQTGGAIVDWSTDGVALLRPISDEALAAGNARKLGCFPLIPYSNRIANAQLSFLGQDYALRPDLQGEVHSIHGNGWYTPWRVAERDDQRLVLALDHLADSDRTIDWPFSYNARQTFELLPDGLAITLEIENRDSRPMPAGLGLHPYFRRSPQSQLSFSTGAVWLNGPDKLPTSLVPVPSGWSFAEPGSPDAVELDNCFAQWDGKVRITWPENHLALTMTASDIFQHLVVFTPAGKDFFCVEPVSHANGALALAATPGDHGARVLAPGDALTGTVRFQLDQLA
ncbi:aldose 1-epimerase [Telmatospirillum sp.]|uniref:aldose 1-epimerase n=1 Tax=Telmatospirillum sp. TaxID=2079197 RepID=UPI002846D7F6|nr:aldose 1-epimerase [Telmatospirillum sp.]MDR3438073.1 aldose 1-epimerase [Telmatospirillum sp.]